MNTINEIPFNIAPLSRLGKNAPKKLYYCGNLTLLNMPKIAIVGSRKMSVYTKNLIIKTACELKNRGICVISGGAIGCDIAAQKAAFPYTIGIFANGLDIIYPKENSEQISKIYSDALAISEYENGTCAQRWQFLERNRIVVAISSAVIIAQADLKSGSLNSAKTALNLGIPIFTFPHRIDESRGTNMLLAEKKAFLIDDVMKFADKICDKLGVQNFKTALNSAPKDEILEFVKCNNDLNSALLKFGDLIYEYELAGKIEIMGTKVMVK